MSNKEEEFPFQQFVQALQQKGDLRKKIKHIVSAICENNVYWIYSAMSTIVQIIKSKDQQPLTKCRSLQAASLLLQTCQYSVLTFVEVYLLPILNQIAIFRAKKSEENLALYFKQTFGIDLNPQSSKLSIQYIQRGVQFVFHAARIKPYRTVETQELKQESHFTRAIRIITDKGVQQPKRYKYFEASKQTEHRKRYLEKLKRFNSQSDEWTQFLLVNLLEQIKTNKKELLELRLLISYGESFLTSSIINFCQEELLQINEKLDQKRKYLGLLNQLIRNGDIQAIILIKNSQFVPTITAHVTKLPGHTSINAGENIFPEIKASKQLKREFYIDFLRSLETWAICLPQQYDSEDFNIKSIWQYLKTQKKFKFPENLNLARFQKEIKENLDKNKERNDRLLQILQNMETSKQQSLDRIPLSKMSNVLQKTTLLAPSHLQARLEQIKKQLKNLTSDQETSAKAFKTLVLFKDSWITYLQSLDFDGADEAHIESLITMGQRYVSQIQMIVPFQANLAKNKLTFKEFKDKVIQTLQLPNDVSQNSIHEKTKQQLKSISMKASKMNASKMAHSKFGKSKMGKSIMQKIKEKSKIGDKTKLEMSKAMNRSNMLQKSKYLDKSRSILEKSKNIDISQKKIVVEVKQLVKETYQVEEEISNNKTYQQESKDIRRLQISKQQLNNSKSLKQIKLDTSNLKKQQVKAQNEKQTSKKQIFKQAQEKSKKREDLDSQEEKIVRVADYQVQGQLNKQKLPEPRPSVSRDKSQGSRLLMRRNRGSRLDRSQDSKQSIEKRSISSNRRIKESSLYKKNQIQHDRTKKISQILQDMHNNKIISNETIEVNGSPINEVTQIQKKNSNLKEGKPFNRFHQEAGEISSIHSNSNIKVFHHSAQKILNLTGQISDIKFEKDKEKEKERQKERETQYVQYFPKQPILPPLVANVYQSPKIHSKISEAQNKRITFQKPQKQLSPQEKEDIPNFKQAFVAKTQKKYNKEKERINAESKVKVEIQKISEKRSQHERQFRKTAKEIKTQKFIRTQDTGPRMSAKQTEQFKKNSISEKHINSNELEIAKVEKEQQIEALRQKVLQLQRQSAFMRAKLAAKDNEIRSIKSASKDGSSRGFAQFTSPSLSNYEKSSLRSSSASKRGEQTPFQRQIESGYKQYLEKIKGNTFRKSLLKSKCLVHKTEQIQIGCLSQRGDKLLDSTLYVTPHRFDILQFTVSVIHDASIKVKIAPQYIKCVPAHKQQKIYLTTQVLKLPFCLPEIEINYKADSQYSSNYHRLTLPLSFNKYCLIQPLDADISADKDLHYTKTDNFKPNGKVLKLQKLNDSFPNFFHMPPTKSRQQHLFVATCQYDQSSFNLLVNIHEKYAWIEGFLIEGQPKAMNFLICTMKEIIEGSKK